MNYKAILEEQIRELQKIQDSNIKTKATSEACEIAKTIIELVREAKGC